MPRGVLHAVVMLGASCVCVAGVEEDGLHALCV